VRARIVIVARSGRIDRNSGSLFRAHRNANARAAPSIRNKRRPVVFIASLDNSARFRWRKALRNSFSVHERGGITGLDNVLRELKPAVLLLDLNLRRLSGIQNIPSIQKLSPSTKIIVLTEFPRLSEELSVLKLGAKGYSGKDISEDLLRKAVKIVQRGELWIGRKMISILLAEVLPANGKNGVLPTTRPRLLLDRLTNKKREIVRFVADGITNKEIARRVNISEATVKAHLTAIFRKFAISNRAQLAALAASDTLVLPTPPISKHV
jgi:two-component system, NarL family, nitrate/nitrite response regulator NarL